MDIVDRLAATVARHSRIVIVCLLLATVVVGSGTQFVEEDTSMDQYYSDTDAARALDYVNRNFSVGPDNATFVQVVLRGENVLSKASMLDSLRLQQSIQANQTIQKTLAPSRPPVGIANLVATVAMAGEQQSAPTVADAQPGDQNGTFAGAEMPSLSAQIDQLESMNESTVDRAVRAVLDQGNGPNEAIELMPRGYEPGSTTANATMIVFTQRTDEDAILDPDKAPPEIIDSQLAMQSISNEFSADHPDEALVFGIGAMGGEINRSMDDSMAIVGPLALLFVLAVLVIAYRDIVDVVLGVLGTAVVLLWTFGIMGWAGIAFNQLMIAVPVLLIGLSIDFAIHVVMRYRERRQHNGDTRRASMATALADVGVALTWVTATTALGFLANYVSPVGPIKDFAIVSAVGIIAALLVFGVFTPALKLEIDDALSALGRNRDRRAFGTGGGRFSSVLSLGARAARRAPLGVLLLVALVSVAGVYGATDVETRFSQEDFIAGDPPGWTENLPAELAPHDYSVKESLKYVSEHFARQDSQINVLLRGDPTDPDALQQLEAARTRAADSSVTQRLSTGEARVRGPLGLMHRVAAENPSFAATFQAADTDGDGVPERNLEAVYDALFAAAPAEAGDVVHRTDEGSYRALRLVVATGGEATHEAIAEEMQSVAAVADGGPVSAMATGNPILFDIISGELFETFVTTMSLALLVIGVLLIAGYRLAGWGATLGALTVLPVVIVLIWILGTMAALGISFNALTGMITSLTIGLGIDYSIHFGQRYRDELDAGRSPTDAMETAATGTGGALLGSAATTTGGFGVLAFALLPGLQQFGIITALTIVYAFVVAVFVFPSLLVLWTRFARTSPSQARLN